MRRELRPAAIRSVEGPPIVSSRGIRYPLDFVYQRAGVAAPIVRGIGPDELPPPYRSLLAHQRNMTLTLERHFGRLVLRTLSTFIRRPWYFRRVLLVQENSGRPVEMGAIRVNLSALPPRIRQ